LGQRFSWGWGGLFSEEVGRVWFSETWGFLVSSVLSKQPNPWSKEFLEKLGGSVSLD